MESATPQWSWPSDLPRERGHTKADAAEASQSSSFEGQNEKKTTEEQPQPEPQPKQRYYGPRYKLERLSWANRLSSAYAQILLTILIFIFSVFLLGFIADPILNLWSDPMGTIADTVANVLDDIEALHEPESEEPGTWLEHFLKGFFSLGLLGFLKSLLAMTPWQWWNIRSSGLLGSTGRRGGTGRARVENINIGLVIIGAVTFMWGVWKAVRAFSASALQKASDRVFDVGGDDDDDDEETKKD
ncbi:E3 ubiquitin-protein ligase MARCH4 [Colletotrichum sp. SAR11_240]|nr:E3 ubiquitin-protein ligase MARCH4 [Colletotrichum sp. SAR11_240]